MSRLAPGVAVPTRVIGAEFAALPADQVVSGSPATRYVDLDEGTERTVGVWEHTIGVSTDVEADEVFVVLAGSGRLEFTEPALPPVDLRPGVVVRLTAGMHTVWSIDETLRKVYITP